MLKNISLNSFIMNGVDFYNKFSFELSSILTKKYSTSFYLSSLFFKKEIKEAIFSIYGFVRLADEIVDSFLEFNQKELLEDFEKEVFNALERGISLNPFLNAFILTVKKYNIDKDLIYAFLKSMKNDLYKKEYFSEKELKEYIYGSAEVVGLMCLKVFVKNNNSLYNELKEYAISLGSAFQKVNFLRDIKYDFRVLKRKYFPNLNFNKFSEEDKNKIIKDIEKEFENAKIGIKKLPKDSKLAVLIAFNYYKALLNKLKETKSSDILKKRIRISNALKFLLTFKSYIQYKFNLI